MNTKSIKKLKLKSTQPLSIATYMLGILHHGHDRTPIFLKNENAFEWLDLLKKDDEFMREELLRQAYHPELNVTIDRPLKAGWEKRK